MKKTFKEIGGTSFHDTVINCSVKTLKKALGEPNYDGNDGEGKVNFDWEMETENGDVFTVYDWKEYRSINEDEIIEWHIGGHSRDVTEQAKREIQEVVIECWASEAFYRTFNSNKKIKVMKTTKLSPCVSDMYLFYPRAGQDGKLYQAIKGMVNTLRTAGFEDADIKEFILKFITQIIDEQ